MVEILDSRAHSCLYHPPYSIVDSDDFIRMIEVNVVWRCIIWNLYCSNVKMFSSHIRPLNDRLTIDLPIISHVELKLWPKTRATSSNLSFVSKSTVTNDEKKTHHIWTRQMICLVYIVDSQWLELWLYTNNKWGPKWGKKKIKKEKTIAPFNVQLAAVQTI